MNIIIQSPNREVVKKSKHLNYRHPPKLLYVNAPSSLNSAQLHLEVEFERLMGSNMSGGYDADGGHLINALINNSYSLFRPVQLEPKFQICYLDLA